MAPTIHRTAATRTIRARFVVLIVATATNGRAAMKFGPHRRAPDAPKQAGRHNRFVLDDGHVLTRWENIRDRITKSGNGFSCRDHTSGVVDHEGPPSQLRVLPGPGV